MNINAVRNLYGASAVTPPPADPLRQAFEKAGTRIQEQLRSNEAQLSSYGKLKSSLAQAESTGRALAATNQSTSPTAFKEKVQALVKTYNETIVAGKSTSVAGQSAASDLRRALSSDSARADLRNMGIIQQADGTLKFENKRFEATQQATPNEALLTSAQRVGTLVEKTSTQSLANGSPINTAVNKLNTRAAALEERQNTQQEQTNAALQSIQQAASRQNALAAAGIASYQRMSRLET